MKDFVVGMVLGATLMFVVVEGVIGFTEQPSTVIIKTDRLMIPARPQLPIASRVA